MYCPQLIVGLDSLDDDANYIHIDDVKDDVVYYCPCCKGKIKPRAVNDSKNYKVQKHFYHESGGCKEETFVHYICKTWLFKKGCKFKVLDKVYEVLNIEIEKTLHTTFGDYRPDIIVNTVQDKIFFFEIMVSNRKSEHLIPKWDDLGNDVVEVDTRDFINKKFKNDIPEFSLIYSDGTCFIKRYSTKEYQNTLAKRKLEWKRQDKINYKINWEKLDWFWNVLRLYSQGNGLEQDVLESFEVLDYSDKIWCFQNVDKKSCINLKEKFKEIINKHFHEKIKDLEKEYDISIIINHVSPLIYMVQCKIKFSYEDYDIHESESTKIKLGKGRILIIEYLDKVLECVNTLIVNKSHAQDILNRIKEVASLPYIRSITPVSHFTAIKYPLRNLYFNVVFEDYIHNMHIKEIIGIDQAQSDCISIRKIAHIYDTYKNEAMRLFTKECINVSLKNNTVLQATLNRLQDKCKNSEMEYLKFVINYNPFELRLLCGSIGICSFSFYKELIFGEFENDIERKFNNAIEETFEEHKIVMKYINTINQCKNKMWAACNYVGDSFQLSLYAPENHEFIKCKRTYTHQAVDLEQAIHSSMIDLLEYAEHYYGIRYLEES